VDISKLKGIDLFSGVGGITLALQDFIEPLCYCEIDPYCQSVLLSRMSEGNLPQAPIWDDIRTLNTNFFPKVDIIYGGFPCTDISVAGRQVGLEGKQSSLFFEIPRLLGQTQASLVFLENVPNIRTKGAERVCKELSERGYDCRWINLSARDVGARHKRERWFLLGYAKHNGLDAVTKPRSPGQTVCDNKEGENQACELKGTDSPRMFPDTTSLGCNEGSFKGIQPKEQEASRPNSSYVCEDLSNSNNKRLEGQCKSERIQEEYSDTSNTRPGKLESEFRRMVNDVPERLDKNQFEYEWEGVPRAIKGLKHRVDRIKALGNSAVPLQVLTAFKILLGI